MIVEGNFEKTKTKTKMVTFLCDVVCGWKNKIK